MDKPSILSSEDELKRKLGFWQIWAIGVGSVIGDGIFVALGEGIQTSGSSAIVAYLIAGLGQLFLMVSLGELAVGMPHAGGMSVWVERFMGDWWGFLSGFTFAAGWVIAGGSTGLAIGQVTMDFFPNLNGDYWPIIFSIFFLTIFALLNIIGVEATGKTQLVLVLMLTIIMALFAIFGFKNIESVNFTPFLPEGASGFWAAIPLGSYAYLGAVTLVTSGSEAKNPNHLPKALVWSSITFLALYTLAEIVAQGVMPWEEFNTQGSPFTVVSTIIFGSAGGFVMNIAAWIACATTILMGTMYSAPRIFYAQAKDGYLPKFLGKINHKTKTPIWGTIVVWAVSVLFIMFSALGFETLYVQLTMQLTLSWLVSWSLALIAGILYRKRNFDEVMQLEWKQPLYPLFPILGILGILIVGVGQVIGTPETLIVGAVWMSLLYLVFRMYSKRNIRNRNNIDEA